MCSQISLSYKIMTRSNMTNTSHPEWCYFLFSVFLFHVFVLASPFYFAWLIKFSSFLFLEYSQSLNDWASKFNRNKSWVQCTHSSEMCSGIWMDRSLPHRQAPLEWTHHEKFLHKIISHSRSAASLRTLPLTDREPLSRWLRGIPK